MEQKHGIGYYFKLIAKKLEANMQKELSKYDLTSQQLNILIYLLKHSECEINQKKLENHFELSNATVSGILKRLELKKLIKRETSKKDRRDKIIVLDEEGYKTKLDVLYMIKNSDEMILDGFSEEEIDQIMNYLLRIKKNIEGGIL